MAPLGRLLARADDSSSTSGDDSSTISGTDAGAAGPSSGNYQLSSGGLIAIIVVVALVSVLGVVSAVLFYLAKKREWELRARIRKSTKKVFAALTPRRSEFPSSVKDSPSRPPKQSRLSRVTLENVPPTPRIRPEQLDPEKGRTARNRDDGSSVSK